MGFLAPLMAVSVSWVAARLLTRRLSRLASIRGHTRTNLHGESVPTSAGIGWALALTAGTVVGAPVSELASETVLGGTPLLPSFLTAVWGFAALGLADDVWSGHEKGFRGHLGALRRGTLTSGGLKLVGGAIVGLAAAFPLVPRGHPAGGAPAVMVLATWIVGGLVTALAANAANFLDTAPGRTVKATLAAIAIMVGVVAAVTVAGPAGPAGPVTGLGRRPDTVFLVSCAAFAGALAGFLPHDLRRRAMLGDAGSNAIGAGLGVLALALSSHLMAWAVVLVALGLINYVGEISSLSRVIHRSRLLAWADGLGRAAALGRATAFGRTASCGRAASLGRATNAARPGRRIYPGREE